MAGDTYPLGSYQPPHFPDQKSYLTRLQHVQRLMVDSLNPLQRPLLLISSFNSGKIRLKLLSL